MTTNKGMTNEEIAHEVVEKAQVLYPDLIVYITEALNTKDSLLAKERALSDRLAGALEDCRRRLVIHGTKDIEIALQAHKEARK